MYIYIYMIKDMGQIDQTWVRAPLILHCNQNRYSDHAEAIFI